jgi:hypothetical protein
MNTDIHELKKLNNNINDTKIETSTSKILTRK